MPSLVPDELREDTSFGVAHAEFPLTFYDRPELMFGNLLRGDLDGLSRSMLAPDTLSPSQMKDVKDLLLKGRKASPITKTVLEIATNPLVIIGALLAYKFPIGSTKAVLDIRNGLMPKTLGMGRMVGGLHGALMRLRSVPDMFNNLWKVIRESENFHWKYNERVGQIFTKARGAGGPISKSESYLVSARLDGLHTAEHDMVKLFGAEPEFVAFMGKKNVPIAPGIQGKMSRRAISISDKLKQTYSDIWDDLFGNPDTAPSMIKSAEKKGIKVGGKREHYHPHQGNFNKYEEAYIRGLSREQYRRYLASEYGQRLGSQQIYRAGKMTVNRDAMLALEDMGAVPTGFTENVVDPILRRWTDDAARVAGDIWDDIARADLTVGEQKTEFIRRMTDYYTKGAGKGNNLLARLGKPHQARDTLDAMASALQDTGGNPEALRRELGSIGEVLARPAEYNMDAAEVFQNYIGAVSKDYGYHATGAGRKIEEIMKTPGIFSKEPHTRAYLEDGLLPHVLGYNSFSQMQGILADSTRQMKLLNWLTNHPMVEKSIGQKGKAALIEQLSKPGAVSTRGLGGKMAGWFHLSTLGLNLSATSANAMQTWITTMNNVGPKGIYRGLMGFGKEAGLIQRAQKYMKLLGKGIKGEVAFRQAFPEFVEEMGSMSKTTERLLEGDIASSGLKKLLDEKGVWGKAKTFIMAPFSKTEAGNQLLSFYSGRNAHLFQNATNLGSKTLAKEANQVGGSLALLTQFAGGPMGIPGHIINVNPLWRQYMHFPMRMLSYLHGTLRMGMDPNKLDWGTIGRILTGSTAAYIAGRNIAGIDLSRGLLMGALPIPGYEKAPFYPFPLVPPAASVLGEAGKALLSGEAGQLGATAAMLFPGGTAIRRAYRGLAPKYADYENPTPDGRLPLYNDEGSLIGTMSPMELTLRSLGLRPQSVSAEVGASKWLLSQRDRVRKYRREYTMALFRNDTREAEKINAEFQKVYPELGPISIKKSDLRSLENRREMSRIHRITRGISSQYRSVFEQVLGEASLANMIGDVEMGQAGALANNFPLQ